MPSEHELAKQFAVSRTAVREAIKALREKRLVDVRPGRGTFIINGMPDAMRHSLGLLMKFGSLNGFSHLVEVREILEPEIAALAASRMTDEYLMPVREAVEIMDTALEDVDVFVEADLDFHLALAEATQNPIIPILVDSIIDLLGKQRKSIGLVNGGLQRGQFHHKQILAAVVQRDSQSARQAMQAHLEQVRRDSEVSSVNAE